MYTYIEFRCQECGQEIYSRKDKEIEQLYRLYRFGFLRCPVCGANMKFVRAIGKEVII